MKQKENYKALEKWEAFMQVAAIITIVFGSIIAMFISDTAKEAFLNELTVIVSFLSLLLASKLLLAFAVIVENQEKELINKLKNNDKQV